MMKINQRESAIDCYHSVVVPKLAESQNSRVMDVIKEGNDYSLSEIMALTNRAGKTPIDKSSMSRVVNGLRAAKRLIEGSERKCSITGIRIIPSKLPTKQGDLF
jgi:hypothetical protein